MANKLIQDLTAGAFALTDLLEHQPIAGPPSLRGDVAALVTLLNTIYAPITGGNYVLKSGDTMSGLLQFSGTGHFGLRLNNLTTAQRDAIGVGSSGMAIWNTTTGRFDMNIGGSWKNFVRLDGDTMTGLLTIAQATANTSALVSTGYSLTGANAQSMIDLAGTWNTSGTPTAIKLTITNTASVGPAMLMDLRVGASSMFSVEKDGDVRGNGQGFFMSATYTTDSYVGWDGTQAGSAITSAPGASGNGLMRLIPWSGTDMRLQFVGTTSAFPSLKRSGTILQARLADDSAFATYQGIHQVAVNATAAAPPVTTHTIPITDAAGVVYRVPCLV